MNGITTHELPNVIDHYNKYMGGVDVVDQELKYYFVREKH